MIQSPTILAAGLVTPAFAIAGAALVSIPIVIHILNRRRFRTVQWAAMEFLLRAMRKNRRRLKFEQWLLLLTRCAVLLLLGLALARPIACEDSSLAAMAARRTALHVLVIDNSYSMAYETQRPAARTHLQQAKQLAADLVARLSAGGESVALITAGAPATAVIAKPTYDLQAARDAVERITQSYSGTDLPGALSLALQIGQEESRHPRKHLYLFTDATRSAWETPQSPLVKQTGQELAKLFRVTHFNLGKKDQWNHATLELKAVGKLLTNKFDSDFLATVRGFGGAGDVVLQWKVDDLLLSGGGSVRLDLNTPPQPQSHAVFRTGGPHVMTASLISDDRLPVDNHRRRIVQVVSELKVLIVEGERGISSLGGSGAFLKLALAPPKEEAFSVAGRSDSYILPDVISDLELGNRVLNEYRAVILTGVGQLQPAQADQIRAFVDQGGTLMLFMGEQVNAEAYNNVLLPRGLLPGPLLKRMTASGDQSAFLFDFKPHGRLHPFLSIFTGEEKSGLDTARVFTYWQLELSPDSKAEPVLNYLPGQVSGIRVQGSGTDGNASSPLNPEPRTLNPDPAITEHALGRGRVVFVSTTANADWTSLPAKPAYVTLVHELLSGSVNTGESWMNLTVGESLQIPPGVKTTAAPILIDPEQNPIVVEQATDSAGRSVYRTRELNKPGIYKLSIGREEIPIAVNVPAAEADVRTLDNAAIRAALGDIELNLENDTLAPEGLAQAAGNDLGWSLMLIVLSLVAVECFMAMRFGHYKRK